MQNRDHVCYWILKFPWSYFVPCESEQNLFEFHPHENDVFVALLLFLQLKVTWTLPPFYEQWERSLSFSIVQVQTNVIWAHDTLFCSPSRCLFNWKKIISSTWFIFSSRNMQTDYFRGRDSIKTLSSFSKVEQLAAFDFSLSEFLCPNQGSKLSQFSLAVIKYLVQQFSPRQDTFSLDSTISCVPIITTLYVERPADMC